jgi:hypothetical protein
LPLILGGLAIGWLPGPGGFIAIIGLALVARVVPGVAKPMDMAEILLRRIWAWFLRRPRWLRLASYVVVLAFMVSMIWFTSSFLFE